MTGNKPNQRRIKLILILTVVYSLLGPCSIIEANSVDLNETLSDQWRFKYFDEQAKDGSWLIREDSVDARLANLVDVVNLVSGAIISTGIHTGAGDTQDLKLEEAAAGDKVDDGLCARQLEQMISLMKDLEQILASKRAQNGTQNSNEELDESHFRLAHVLDSFGRYEAGALAGRYLFLGSHSQCIGSSLILNHQRVELRHCLARLSLAEKVDLELTKKGKSWFTPDTQLSSAICIPKSCHSKSFRKNQQLFRKLVESQFRLPKSIYLHENLPIDSIYCPVDESSHLLKIPFIGWLFLAILFTWFAMTICATYLSSKAVGKTGTEKKTIITWLDHTRQSLDLKSSMEDFIGGKGRPNHRVDLDMLNAIKVLGCFYVAFGHSLMIGLNSSQNQLKAQYDLENDPLMYLAMGGTVIVDCFFLITGLMIGYLGAKRVLKEEVNGSMEMAKKSFQFAAARYLRLVPLYALIYYFKRLILTNLNSNLPRWDHGLDHRTIVGACKQEKWLTPFTFIAAYLPLARSCIPQTWSVAADMLFGVTMGPVVVLMSKRPRLVIPIVAGVCVASVWNMLQGYRALDSGLRFHLGEMKLHAFARLFNEFTELYSMPHNRIFAALIGSVAGYFLLQYGEFSKPKEWPWWFKGPATKLSLYLMVSLLLMPTGVPLLRNTLLKIYPIHHSMFDHSMTTGRLIWCLAVAVIFLRLMTDWKDSGFWVRLNTGSFWKSMVRLNYPILLIHMDLQLIDIYMQTTIAYNSWHKNWVLFCYSYLTSVVIAVPLHVIFENPIDRLIKGFMIGYNGNSKIVTADAEVCKGEEMKLNQ